MSMILNDVSNDVSMCNKHVSVHLSFTAAAWTTVKSEPVMAQPIRWRGTARIRGPTKSIRMVLLTLVLVGLQ